MEARCQDLHYLTMSQYNEHTMFTVATQVSNSSMYMILALLAEESGCANVDDLDPETVLLARLPPASTCSPDARASSSLCF